MNALLNELKNVWQWVFDHMKKITEDKRYTLLVIISDNDYTDSILGDADAEAKWEPVVDKATDTKLWRFTAGKALLDGNGERLTTEQLAQAFGLDHEILTTHHQGKGRGGNH
ncbi:hypothetical protein SynMEDNS5_01593 [Synechococcus sp. MEDNS5]|uniref:hypothetical protein n=1 Tax=Synechococcus sp. MEDNS5 TaxID=1442554 RepID=UPI0016450D03|nr:hypothetical protein [Synechococcus sp. MEDNS5]QNJ06310.1 hypothetical protein SynMEDNS5_01593 [Synechococcus sp. MEDNS5]